MYFSDWISTSPYSTGYCIQTNLHLTFKATAQIRLENAYIQRNNKQVKCVENPAVENPAVLLKFARGKMQYSKPFQASAHTGWNRRWFSICFSENSLPQNFLPELSSESTLSTASSRIATVSHLPQLTYNPYSAPHLSLLDCLPWPCEIMQTQEFFGMSLQWVWRQRPPQTGSLEGERPVWDGGTRTVEQIQAASLFASPLGFWFGQSSNSIN